jgi:hypothetical protein
VWESSRCQPIGIAFDCCRVPSTGSSNADGQEAESIPGPCWCACFVLSRVFWLPLLSGSMTPACTPWRCCHLVVSPRGHCQRRQKRAEVSLRPQIAVSRLCVCHRDRSVTCSVSSPRVSYASRKKRHRGITIDGSCAVSYNRLLLSRQTGSRASFPAPGPVSPSGLLVRHPPQACFAFRCGSFSYFSGNIR